MTRRPHPADRDAINAERRSDDLQATLDAKQWRADVQAVMRTDAGRRMVWAFIQACGLDATAFNTNAMAQSYRNGQQDSARWWLDQIRTHCPEQEARMRVENTKPRQPAPADGDDDDN